MLLRALARLARALVRALHQIYESVLNPKLSQRWPRAARDARKRQERRLAEESSSVTYKVVVPGSGTWKKWKTVTETGGERTREEMLDMRAKNKTDRHAR